jgi:hypothetical protein
VSVRIDIEGLDAVQSGLRRNKDKIANDLHRYVVRVSSRFQMHIKDRLVHSTPSDHDGVETGQLRESISFQVEGDKYSQLISTIGPLGRQQSAGKFGMTSTTNLGMFVAFLIEKGYTIRKAHFVPFSKAPQLETWLERQGWFDAKTFSRRPTGIMVKPRTYAGIGYMKGGFAEGQRFATMKWNEMVQKWRQNIMQEALG